MTVVAIIDDSEFEDKTVLAAGTVAEVAACFGAYLAATGAPCCPPPPVTADPDGWVAWLSAFIDEDECCPVDISVYADELILTPRRHTLAEPVTTPRQWREWVARAAPAIRLSRDFDACARDVTASL